MHIACDDSWVQPDLSGKGPKWDNVYLAEDGRLYTFELDRATCPDCKSVKIEITV